MASSSPTTDGSDALFAFAIAHDLRQPLVASMMTIEPLLARTTDPIIIAGLTLVREGLQDGLTRIEALLTLARLTRMETWHRSVDLSQLTRVALSRLATIHPFRVIDGHIPEGVSVASDERMVAIIIDNLVANAVTHGISSDDVARVRLQVEPSERGPVVVIRDHGPGLRAPPVSSAPHAGGGLGLSISRAAVAHLGGELWHEPAEPGTRACFRVP